MPGRDNRFTIYDALEKSGYFDKNPANSYARDTTDGSSLYKGPVSYPKMFYHPLGEEKITVPAEVISTPMGAKEVGEQRELIWQLANSAAEDKALRADGWWDHPAKAIRARVEAHIERLSEIGKMDDKTRAKLLATIPTMSSDQRIKDLEAEITRLTGQREDEQALRTHDGRDS
jgi:hypothetical protein